MAQDSLPRWRYRPQSYAVTAGGVIFLSAGMNMSLSVGWTQCFLFDVDKHLTYSWFLGVIFGTVLSLLGRNFFRSRFQIVISATMIFIGGILFASIPENSRVFLAARYLNGIAVGLNVIPFIEYASEIAADSYRGKCLCMEQYYLSLGVALQMIYANLGSSLSFSTCSLHGIIDILVACLAFVSLIYFIESPLHHIRRGNETAALDSLARLLMPLGDTGETYAMFDKRSSYVLEQLELSIAKNIIYSMVPLLKMLLFRSMMLAFCFSLPLNDAIRMSLSEEHRTWLPAVAAGCRAAGAIIALCLMDHINRKWSSLLPMALVGGLLIGLATISDSDLQNDDATSINAAYLYICMQLFLGFLTPFASIYAGEAFPMQAKPFFVGICVIVEQLIQIALIRTESVNLANGLLVQGIIIELAFLLLCLTLPETRNTSLSVAQRRFRKFLNLKSNL